MCKMYLEPAGNRRSIWLAVLEMILLSLGVCGVCGVVVLDITWVGRHIREVGITEVVQACLLLASTLIFMARVMRRPASRGCDILVAGLLLSMFIREMDEWLDRIAHGFWLLPVMLVVACSLALAWRWRATLPVGMGMAARARSFVYIMVGLAIVIGFSRLFGSRQFWHLVLPPDDPARYAGLVKTTVQEALELLGYLLIFFGSVLAWLTRPGAQAGLPA